MSLSFVNKIKAWRKKEKGVAEIYSAIIILPVLMSMILVLLEMGVYIHYRGISDTILQDTVRGISLESGSNNPRVNTIGSDWITRGQNELYSMCVSQSETNYVPGGRCSSAPTIICDDSSNQNIAKLSQGISFSCTVTVSYKTVSPLSKNPAFSMGLSGLFNKPISITITSNVTGGA